jgi:hypothetical protein
MDVDLKRKRQSPLGSKQVVNHHSQSLNWQMNVNSRDLIVLEMTEEGEWDRQIIQYALQEYYVYKTVVKSLVEK